MDIARCAAASALGAVFLGGTKVLLSAPASPTFWALFLVQYGALKAYRLFYYPYYVSPLRVLPGPMDHHFLLGQTLHQFNAATPNEPFVSWMRQWPEAQMIRYFTFGNSEALLATGLQAIKEILQTNVYSFVKPASFVRMTKPIAGEGLGLIEGNEHKQARKLLNGPFGVDKVRNLVPVFQEKARELADRFEKARQMDEEVNVVTSYSSLTLDIICVAVLGVDLRSYSPTTPFHECYNRLFDPPLIGQILIAINSLVVPVRWLPLKENREFKRNHELIHGMVRQIVRQRMEEVDGWGKGGDAESSRKDILTHMIEESNATGEPWSEEKLHGHVMLLMLAGHETTAGAMVWATHCMIKHPDVQKRLRHEIRDLLSQKPQPDYSDIESLPYLNNFCREVLRMYTPGIGSPREALHDVVICGVKVPKGTSIAVMPEVIHKNPAIWGEDADEFNPDRWDHLSGEAAGPHAFAAFLMGPRMCIARSFAMIEFKAILIELVSRFAFEAAYTEPIVVINPCPLLRPKGGLQVKVRLAEE